MLRYTENGVSGNSAAPKGDHPISENPAGSMKNDNDESHLRPVCKYGQSKREFEKLVLKTLKNAVVL